MHILFLSDNFFPEVNAPASRTHDHAKEWIKAGHQVTIITCVPNFPKGQVFDGYRNKVWQEEIIDGIRVVRVWSYIAANEGFYKRILDYLSYMITSFLASFLIRKVDIVIGTSPQFFTAVSAWLVSCLKRRPFVFELRDLWPESIRAVGAMKNRSLMRNLERLELFLYNQADAIIAVTDSFKNNLIKRGIPAHKIHIVYNGANLNESRHTPKDFQLLESLGLTDKFVIGYIGTHGMAQKLETILDCAKRFNTHYPKSKVHFLFVGEGADKNNLKSKAIELKLANITFIDAVSRAEIVRYWSILDASIIHLKNTKEFCSVIPSKLFEAMSMGVPIIHGVRGESAKIVDMNEVGLCFEPQNAIDLEKKILTIYNSTSLRRKFSHKGPIAAKAYDRRTLARGMLDFIESLIINRIIRYKK